MPQAGALQSALRLLISVEPKVEGWLELEITDDTNPFSPDNVACYGSTPRRGTRDLPQNLGNACFILRAVPVMQISASAHETSHCIELYLLPHPVAYFKFH